MRGLQSDQGLQVVAQHFCRNILLDSKLRQTRGVFQIQAMLEALERFLDTPALMIEIGKSIG